MSNTSSAVMQQRKEPSDSFDYFPTPAWATRALCEWIDLNTLDGMERSSALEPACGEGHMARVLNEYFRIVYASDIQDLGYGEVSDYLFPKFITPHDWVITNPPFKLAEQFILKALDEANAGVAMFVRSAFVESVGRYERLFSKYPPSDILQFVERVPLVKGRVDAKASSATAYCWLVWDFEQDGQTKFHWIPPCRKRLERPEDYA